jgi:peptide/nickel transport system substrate-binding protein
VTLQPIESGPARVAALLAGDVDLIEGVPTTDLARLKENPDLQISEGVSNRVIYLHLDQFREDSPHITAKDDSDIKNPLLDARVRQAISKAIDREAIVERVMEGQAIPAGQLLPEGFFGVSENLEPVAFDPDGAKALLEEAGYGDGWKMTVHGPQDRYLNDARILEAIAQMLTRLGIDTSVETLPPSVFFNRASRGGEGETPEFSFILVGWGAGSGEASSPLRSLIRTGGASTRGNHSNPEIDALIDEALQTVDDEKREELLATATEKAIESGAIIPLHYQVNAWAAKKGITYEPRTDEYTLPQSTSAAM